MFTELEIQYLLKNKYIKNVTSKGLIYTNEFKFNLLFNMKI